MMGFSTLNFVETQKAVSDDKTKDPQLPLLIPYHMVTSYLRHYSIPLLPYIQFSTQVVSVVPIPDQSATGKSFPPLTKWQVTTKHLPTNKTTTHSLYDALIISNGHYTVPYLPAIRGIEAFSSKYPDNISHSRDFRTEAPFTNCKTVMIGNSASAIDIGQQISHVCSGPLIRVVRTNNPGNDPNCYLSLEEFIADGEDSDTSKGGSIKFLRPDGSSHIEHGVQKVLFATGYLYTLPFLNAQAPDTSTTTSSSIPLLPPTGHYLRSLYLYFLSTTHPTLSILNTPMKILPFPLAEAQVSVLTRLYLGKIPLPLPSEMQTWETQTIAKKGPGKSFMVLNEPAEDLEYCNGLVDWANQAEDKTEGKPENEPTARPRSTSQTRLPRLPLPPKYTKKQKWLRTMFPEIRRRFMERGDRRKEVRTWEDLGIWWEGGDEEGEGRVE
ncbi:putative flavin dependent [Phaeomoniella chlamydospora]|uniref:Putative flavin dependent n=1 Tax=Phaeomoniella chlamydospora TaxID=158046 RepID=A0A0G2DYE8_PHACM|nr:putative flavin dependent [Phaeomoniella chlamydospora]